MDSVPTINLPLYSALIGVIVLICLVSSIADVIQGGAKVINEEKTGV